jgi:putative colanic acid biosynthesis UDP-glucose lipid carrier transferase
MLSNRSVGIRTLALLWQMILVTLSFWGWLFIWQNAAFDEGMAWPRYCLYNEFLLVGVLFGSGGKRPGHEPVHAFVEANRRTLRQGVVGMFCVFMVVIALNDYTAPRSFLFSYLPWLYLTLLGSNYLLPRTLGQWAFSGARRERVGLVGTVEQALQLQPWLERKNLLGLQAVGLVCSEDSRANGLPFPVLGRLDQVGEILQRESITQVIVLDLTLGSARLRQLTQTCEGAAVRLLALNNLNAYFGHTTMMFEDEGMRFVGLREEPLESPVNRFVKRAMDLAAAVPVVALVLPATTLAVWLAQRFQSPGPVFLLQTRSGMMGRPFKMIKYRTMHVHNPDEARQASQGDSRIFPAGRWLRKTSLDELPQFINVLRGDMSVIGPRPHLPRHDELFTRAMRTYVIRKLIRPGITGWAQVNGYRGEVHTENDIAHRVEADIHYLENWSFSLDCLIVLKTMRHCIFPPRSAY